MRLIEALLRHYLHETRPIALEGRREVAQKADERIVCLRRAFARGGVEHNSSARCIRQHTSTYVSIHQHTSAYVSIRQHTPANVSIRQHTSAYLTHKRWRVYASGRRARVKSAPFVDTCILRLHTLVA